MNIKMDNSRQVKLLWVVVPVFNEEDVLINFHEELTKTLDDSGYKRIICYVNDGSTDRTLEILKRLVKVDKNVMIVDLTRNFGHQAAISAGLDLAEGDVVITMDGDGQHPPEMIPNMISLYEAGHDLILTQRVQDHDISLIKRLASSAFYKLMRWISDTDITPASSDFRLMSTGVVQALRKFREYHRFLRGLVAWLGYEPVILQYSSPPRKSGVSKYSPRKMIRLAMDAVFSFSLIPLRIGILLGLFFIFLAFIEAIYVLRFWLLGMESILAPGWSSLMFVLLMVGGSIMVMLSIIGLYMGYIFQEVKRRPVYIIRATYEPSGTN
ncbi:MAG: glycosyltransferase family 2 protein [Desulfobacteraceae bacterium]|nr:glycosyltransferase family 2 protein [Desulfobacteraceae bacterium]